MPSPATIALVPSLAASVPAERREAVERAAFQFALALLRSAK
jgi:hypothetical protein